MSNIAEIQNLLGALNELTISLIQVFRNGVNSASVAQMGNLLEVDKDLQIKLEQAFANYKSLSDEIANLSLANSMSLALTQLSYLQQILTALKPNPTPAPLPNDPGNVEPY